MADEHRDKKGCLGSPLYDKVNLENVQGHLSYASQKGLSIDHLNAQFLGQNAVIDVSKELLSDTSEVTYIILKSQLNFSKKKGAMLPPAWRSVVEGSTPYELCLGFLKKQYFLTLQSRLEGVALHFPAPLKKEKTDSKILNVVIVPKGVEKCGLQHCIMARLWMQPLILTRKINVF